MENVNEYELPHFYKLIDFLFEEASLPLEERFSEVDITLKFEDLVRLFLVSVDDCLDFEYAFITDKDSSELKVKCEKVRADDRLERFVQIMQQIGISEEVIKTYVWACRQNMLAKLQAVIENPDQ